MREKQENYERTEPATAEEIGRLDQAMVSLFGGNHRPRANDADTLQCNGLYRRMPYMGKNGELGIGISRSAEHGSDTANHMEVVVKHTREGSPSWVPSGEDSKFTFSADESGVMTHCRTYSKYDDDGKVADTTGGEVRRFEMDRLIKLVESLESADRAEKQDRSFIIRYFANQRIFNNADKLIGANF
ncbi:hypothetical protein FWF74_02200 [Candidatus Saccharibacteria bacterium]|nr:hypothetical protein [Candidatus Saccharibacteria bacterium]